jgi:hypothetical protein
MDGYPVVWCPREGYGQAIPNFAAAATADFFKQFRAVTRDCPDHV